MFYKLETQFSFSVSSTLSSSSSTVIDCFQHLHLSLKNWLTSSTLHHQSSLEILVCPWHHRGVALAFVILRWLSDSVLKFSASGPLALLIFHCVALMFFIFYSVALNNHTILWYTQRIIQPRPQSFTLYTIICVTLYHHSTKTAAKSNLNIILFGLTTINR